MMHKATNRKKNLGKLAATLALVAGAAGVAGVGTFGAYTDTTVAEAAVSSDKVSVLMNGNTAGVTVPAADMVTGDRVVAPLTITREQGSALLGKADLVTEYDGDPALLGALKLSVSACTSQWQETRDSQGNPDLACPAGATRTDLSTEGALGANGSVNGWGGTHNWVDALNANVPVYLRLELLLPTTAPDTTADKTANVTWTVTATQRAGKRTLVQPTAATPAS